MLTTPQIILLLDNWDGGGKTTMKVKIGAAPCRELTYPYTGTCEADFPFPKVGHVSFLEGITH